MAGFEGRVVQRMSWEIEGLRRFVVRLFKYTNAIFCGQRFKLDRLLGSEKAAERLCGLQRAARFELGEPA